MHISHTNIPFDRSLCSCIILDESGSFFWAIRVDEFLLEGVLLMYVILEPCCKSRYVTLMFHVYLNVVPCFARAEPAQDGFGQSVSLAFLGQRILILDC